MFSTTVPSKELTSFEGTTTKPSEPDQKDPEQDNGSASPTTSTTDKNQPSSKAQLVFDEDFDPNSDTWEEPFVSPYRVRELEEIMEQEGVDRTEALLIQYDEFGDQQAAEWKAQKEAAEKARLEKEAKVASDAKAEADAKEAELLLIQKRTEANASFKTTRMWFFIALTVGTLCFAGFFLMGGL
jgi:hypothetical protein